MTGGNENATELEIDDACCCRSLPAWQRAALGFPKPIDCHAGKGQNVDASLREGLHAPFGDSEGSSGATRPCRNLECDRQELPAQLAEPCSPPRQHQGPHQRGGRTHGRTAKDTAERTSLAAASDH